MLREKYPAYESKVEIDADEDLMRKLLIQKNFAEHEMSQAILADAQQRVEDINFMLANDEELNKGSMITERYALFRLKEVWQFIIERFDGSYAQAQLKALEDQIDEQLDR